MSFGASHEIQFEKFEDKNKKENPFVFTFIVFNFKLNE